MPRKSSSFNFYKFARYLGAALKVAMALGIVGFLAVSVKSCIDEEYAEDQANDALDQEELGAAEYSLEGPQTVSMMEGGLDYNFNFLTETMTRGGTTLPFNQVSAEAVATVKTKGCEIAESAIEKLQADLDAKKAEDARERLTETVEKNLQVSSNFYTAYCSTATPQM